MGINHLVTAIQPIWQVMNGSKEAVSELSWPSCKEETLGNVPGKVPGKFCESTWKVHGK